MLADYVPVYYPETNQWSIPNRELDHDSYEDYVPEPQEITLYEKSRVRGIPLVHFGTWGLIGVTTDALTEMLRGFVKDPKGTIKCRGKKATAATVAFFEALAEKYPDAAGMTEYRDPDDNGLGVPPCCVVRVGRPGRSK